MAIELATGYVSIAPSADGFGEALSRQVSGATAAQGDAMGSVFGSGFTLAAGTAIAAGAAGIGVGLFKIGESFDSAFDTIRVNTGKTGSELDGLEQSFKRVVSTVPTDFGSAADAVSILNQRLGSTGGLVEAQATQFLNLSRITKTDLAANIEDVTRLYGDWGITVDDQAERLDQLFRASQVSGVGLGQLAQQAVQFGAPLRGMGFNLDESVGLLAAFNKTGVNTELVMGSMRIALGKFASEGVTDTKAALLDLFEQIKRAPSEGEAAAIAMEKFGARAGADMADTIRGGKFEIADMLDTISNGSDTINQAAADTADFSEKWSVFKNRVLVGLEPIATRVFDGMAAAMDKVGPLFDQLTASGESLLAGIGGGEEVMARLQASAQQVFTDVTAFVVENRATFEEWGSRLAHIMTTAGRVMTQVLEAAQLLWRTFGDTILSYVAGAFSATLAIIDGALRAIQGVFDLVLGVLTGDWSRAWDGIKNIVGGVWDVITGAIEYSLNWIKGIISAALALIGVDFDDAWRWITGIVTGAWTWVETTISNGLDTISTAWHSVWGAIGRFFGGIWDGIKQTALDAFQWVVLHVIDPLIGGLTKFIDLYNSIDILPDININLQPIGPTLDFSNPTPSIVAGDDIRDRLAKTAARPVAASALYAPNEIPAGGGRTSPWGMHIEKVEVNADGLKDADAVVDMMDRKLGWRMALHTRGFGG